MKEVVTSIEMQGLSIGNTSSHGFSEQLISDMVSKCSDIFTIEDVLSNFPVFSVGAALHILEILQEIFLDIPNLEKMLALFSFSLDFSLLGSTWKILHLLTVGMNSTFHVKKHPSYPNRMLKLPTVHLEFCKDM